MTRSELKQIIREIIQEVSLEEVRYYHRPVKPVKFRKAMKSKPLKKFKRIAKPLKLKTILK